MKEPTYREVYDEGAARLAEAGIGEAELDARLLLEFVCGTDRNTLLVHGERETSTGAGPRADGACAVAAPDG